MRGGDEECVLCRHMAHTICGGIADRRSVSCHFDRLITNHPQPSWITMIILSYLLSRQVCLIFTQLQIYIERQICGLRC